MNEALSLLLKKCPIIALRLLHCKTSSKGTEEVPLEVKEKQVQGSKVIFQLGLGGAKSYHLLKEWLSKSPKHALYYIEDRLEAFMKLCEQAEAKEVLSHPSVNFIFIKTSSTFSNFPCFEDFTSRAFITIPSYKNERAEFVSRIRVRFNNEVHRFNNFLQEQFKLGKTFYSNFYPNLLHLSSFINGEGLKSRFKGVPAILCGAGPSIKKQLPTIKKLSQRALIIAGGGAMGVLAKAGVVPHLTVGIDPTDAEWTRFWNNNAFEAPLIFRLRLNKHALNLAHGPKLFFSGATCYQTSEWLSNKFSIPYDSIDEGFSCITLALRYLHLFGCNPIIFCGLDLSSLKGVEYAPGVGHNESPQVCKEEISWESKEFYSDIHGDTVQSKWKWLAESAMISQIASDQPMVRHINATEGGIGFKEIPAQSLRDIHLPVQKDISSFLHTEIQSLASLKGNVLLLKESIDSLKDSFYLCLEYLEALQQLALEEKKNSAIEALLYDEEAYVFFLKQFDLVIRNMQDIRSRRDFEIQDKVKDCFRLYLLEDAVFYHLKSIEVIEKKI